MQRKCQSVSQPFITKNLERSDGDIDILKTYMKSQRVPIAVMPSLRA
jgi:hypothetical protein